MPLPRVSIIILNWNSAKDTMISIASVKAQSFQDFEIILVDNASTDNSVEVLNEVSEIRLIQSDTNTGFSGGVNYGLGQIDLNPERFVLLLNNDAQMDSEALTLMMDAMDRSPSVGVLGGMILNMEDDCIQFPGGGHLNYLTGSSKFQGSGNPDFISGAFMLIRTEVFSSLGGFSKNYFMYWEDVDFSLRVRASGWKLGVCSEAIARHKSMGSTGANSPVYDYNFTRSGTHFFWAGAGRRHMIPIMVIVGKKIIKRTVFGPQVNLIAILRGLLDGFKLSRSIEK